MKLKKKKKQKHFGGKSNLHQSKFEFYPEASALIFQLRMPSAVKIMLSYTVVTKQVHRAKNRKRGGGQQIKISETIVPDI